jgi:galactokinase
MVNSVREIFEQKFGAGRAPVLFRSPGRVNLIGEHTDYNDGFVLPAAVDRAIVFAVALRPDRICRMYAIDVKQDYEGRVDPPVRVSRGWPNYVLGVVDQMVKAGYPVTGFDCVFGGDVPLGAGMSSSAALEGGIAVALNELTGFGIDSLSLARMAQKAEHDFVGVRCGIMDQFINIHGKQGHVVRLDCRSLEYEYVPFGNEDLRIVVCDTRVRRSLASSEYNIRRSQCESGVAVLRASDPSIRSLRDATPDLLDRHRAALGDLVYRRCRYVVEENARVVRACAHLGAGDFVSFGMEMDASHAGLRDDYEVSCQELDSLVELARTQVGVLGARMMGAGFGGCTINLVAQRHLPEFVSALTVGYSRETGKEPGVYATRIAGGTERLAAPTATESG